MTLVLLAAAWIAGLLVGLQVDAGVWPSALFAVAATCLVGLLRVARLPLWPGVLGVVLVAGLVRVEASGEPARLDVPGPRTVALRGVVATDPETSGPAVEFTLRVEEIDLGEGWTRDEGRVLVRTRPLGELVQRRESPYFRYGDVLEIEGGLQVPAKLGNFDYGKYLAAQGIGFVMPFPDRVSLLGEGGGNAARAFLYKVRRGISRRLDEALPEPQASLAQALLLGLRDRIPEDMAGEFRDTGTSHLLAISGLHVGTVLATSIAAGAWALGRRRQVYLLLPLAAVWGYALLSGLSPSVERAAIMGSVYLLAILVGRPRTILPPLAFAAAVMAGKDPGVLKEVSFQLSFAAMAGIAFLSTSATPWWEHMLGADPGAEPWWRHPARWCMAAIGVGVAATVATLPLVAFYFQQVPTVGIPATVLALPAMPPLLLLSLIAATGSAIHPELGQVLGWLAWVPLEYLIQLVHLFSRVPGSTFSVPAFSGLLVWGYYAALVLLVWRLGMPARIWRRLASLVAGWRAGSGETGPSGYRNRIPAIWIIGFVGVSALAGVLWSEVMGGSDGMLHVHFLDVGQGDAILVVSPEGTKALIDGGPHVLDAARALGRRLSGRDHDLDLFVLTHPDEDHFRGLPPVLDRYDVGTVFSTGVASPNPLYLEWVRAVEDEAPRRITALQGQSIALGPSTFIQVLNPETPTPAGTSSDFNNGSAVLRLVHEDVSFLLTADIESETEGRLVRSGQLLQSTVLKVAHHGSRSSSTTGFLAAVSPRAAVISAGAPNPYGHPHAEVLQRLGDVLPEGQLYTTARHGDVEFVSDGERLWVRTGG